MRRPCLLAYSLTTFPALFPLGRLFGSSIVAAAMTSSTKSASSAADDDGGAASTAKSLTPPTIANPESHQRILSRFAKYHHHHHQDTVTTETMPGSLAAYAAQHSLRPSPHLASLLATTENLPRAVMAGAPDEANFLCLLLELMQARVVVEVGVFRGLTTLALAECLRKMDQQETPPQQSSSKDDNVTCDRRVIGLDVSAEYAAVGQEAWKQAGVDSYIDFRVGDAKATMAQLVPELGTDSVDMVFIDADKTSYDAYYEYALQLVRPGGLIVVDNTLWGSSVAVSDDVLQQALQDAKSTQNQQLENSLRDTMAIKALNAKIHQDTKRIERVSFLTIADGVTVCRKK